MVVIGSRTPPEKGSDFKRSPFKSADERWQKNELDKANESAASFGAKFVLPPVSEDQFVTRPTHVQKDFLKTLQGLDIKIATGQNGIGARILKDLADALAYPIAVLSRRILYEGCWPDRWRSHLLMPIYKKCSVYATISYRDIHLKTIMSKVVERTIGNPLIPICSHMDSAIINGLSEK